MSQNEIHDTDELLNSFLDGELDARHQTEVQRLIKNDEKIAQRLLELQKCKRLVSSLPYTEAPKELLSNIKASLPRRQAELEGKKFLTPSVPPMQRHRERKGARHLLFRRLTAAAAMIALVGVLAAVIYSIVAPEVTINMPAAVEKPGQAVTVAVATAEKPVKFTGRLELKTANPSEVAAFLNKAIELNVPSDRRVAAAPDMLKEAHVLTCNRQNLRALMDELGTIWGKIDSATLLVNTDQPQGQVVINAVTPEQITEIAEQDNFQTQIKAAKYFAVMNNMAKLIPGKEVTVAINNSSPGLITIPKPVLTSSKKPVTTAGAAKQEQQVLLTIVVTGRK
jgi:hypothetical protein